MDKHAKEEPENPISFHFEKKEIYLKGKSNNTTRAYLQLSICPFNSSLIEALRFVFNFME